MPKFAMADGREFTNFLPNCELTAMLQKKYNITNSHDLRYYLQKNAEQVMKDMADCQPKKDCTLCPVCKSSLEWKPSSN